LERAHDAHAVTRRDPRRGRRVHPRQQPVEPRVAEALPDGLEPPAQLGIARRPGEEALQERLQVEAGPARDDRQPTPGRDAAERFAGAPRVLRRGEIRVGRDDVDEVVRNEGALLRKRLRAADVEAAIDRQAVAGDDLAAVAERQPERERALAGGRRPDDRDQRRRSNRQTVHSRTSVSSTTAPRICWRNASFKGAGPRSPLAEGLDDVALVLGPERAL